MKYIPNKFTFILIIIFTSFTKCRERNESQIKFSFNYNVKKDIPLGSDFKPSGYYDLKNLIVDKLGLDTLEFGFDSIYIRVWYFYTFNKECQMFEFYKNKEGWISTYNCISSKKCIENEYSKFENRRKYIYPKNSWSNFESEFNKNKITSLPNDSELLEYVSISDGDIVCFEIGTKSDYRFYMYSDPNYNQKIEEARLVVNFMRLIESEFGIKRLREF